MIGRLQHAALQFHRWHLMSIQYQKRINFIAFNHESKNTLYQVTCKEAWILRGKYVTDSHFDFILTWNQPKMKLLSMHLNHSFKIFLKTFTFDEKILFSWLKTLCNTFYNLLLSVSFPFIDTVNSWSFPQLSGFLKLQKWLIFSLVEKTLKFREHLHL